MYVRFCKDCRWLHKDKLGDFFNYCGQFTWDDEYYDDQTVTCDYFQPRVSCDECIKRPTCERINYDANDCISFKSSKED